MTKTIPLILAVLSSVACGGEPFGPAVDFSDVGGDVAGAAGAPEDIAGSASAGAPSTAGGAAHGGSMGDGGASAGSAGKPVGGSSTGGSVSTGGAGGAAPSCALDISKITESMPHSLTWTKWSYANTTACVACVNEPCALIDPATWAEPVMIEEGTLRYVLTSTFFVSVAFGSKTCDEQSKCNVDAQSVSIDVHVERNAAGWVVTSSRADVFFTDNSCLETAAAERGLAQISYQMGVGFEENLASPLVGLKIACE